MTNNTSTSSVTVSGGGLSMVLLTIALGAAKIFGYLDISWWLVFLPMYIGLVILLVLIALFLIGAGVVKGAEKYSRRKARKERQKRIAGGATPSRRNYLR